VTTLLLEVVEVGRCHLSGTVMIFMANILDHFLQTKSWVVL